MQFRVKLDEMCAVKEEGRKALLEVKASSGTLTITSLSTKELSGFNEGMDKNNAMDERS